MSKAGRPSERLWREKRIRAVATEHIAGPGVYYMAVGHDDGCPTLKTQNIEDCTCDPEAYPPQKLSESQ